MGTLTGTELLLLARIWIDLEARTYIPTEVGRYPTPIERAQVCRVLKCWLRVQGLLLVCPCYSTAILKSGLMTHEDATDPYDDRMVCAQAECVAIRCSIVNGRCSNDGTMLESMAYRKHHHPVVRKNPVPRAISG